MTRKRCILITLLICTIFGMLFLVFLNKDKIGRKVVEIVAWELDREREKEVGYYNVVEWNDGTFQINHSSSGNRFEMLKNNTTNRRFTAFGAVGLQKI